MKRDENVPEIKVQTSRVWLEQKNQFSHSKNVNFSLKPFLKTKLITMCVGVKTLFINSGESFPPLHWRG